MTLRTQVSELGQMKRPSKPSPKQINVFIDRGEIFRSFNSVGSRMDPYVEVDIGRRADYDGINWRWVATSPVAERGNQNPVWEYRLRTQDFTVDEELRVTVLVRHTWRKDVLVGIGYLPLSKELVQKRAAAEDIRLHKRKWKGPEEHTGWLQVQVDFPVARAQMPDDHPRPAGLSASMPVSSFRQVECLVAKAASLDDVGYREVLATSSPTELVIFCGRVNKLIRPIGTEDEGEVRKLVFLWIQDQRPPKDFLALVEELRLHGGAVSASGSRLPSKSPKNVSTPSTPTAATSILAPALTPVGGHAPEEYNPASANPNVGAASAAAAVFQAAASLQKRATHAGARVFDYVDEAARQASFGSRRFSGDSAKSEGDARSAAMHEAAFEASFGDRRFSGDSERSEGNPFGAATQEAVWADRTMQDDWADRPHMQAPNPGHSEELAALADVSLVSLPRLTSVSTGDPQHGIRARLSRLAGPNSSASPTCCPASCIAGVRRMFGWKTDPG